MDREAFIAAYCERSGMTRERLRMAHLNAGLEPIHCIPCSCGDEICEGWQMTKPEYAHPTEEGLFSEATKV